jgi:hypothetical protein
MTNIAVSNRYIYHYSFVDNWRAGASTRQCLRQLLLFNRRFCVAGHKVLDPLRISFKAKGWA